MSFKVLIVSSMVGMLLPLLKFKISSSRKWAKYSVRSGFGYKIVTSVSKSSRLESALFFAERRQKAPQNVFSKSATILF